MSDHETPESESLRRTPPGPPAAPADDETAPRPSADPAEHEDGADAAHGSEHPVLPASMDWLDHPRRRRQSSRRRRRGPLRRLKRKWRRWRRHRRTLADVSPWYRPRNIVLGIVGLILLGLLSVLISAYVRVSDIERAPLLPLASGPSSLGTNIVLLGSDGQAGSLTLDSKTLVVQFIHISAGYRSGEVVDLPRDLVIGAKDATVGGIYATSGVPGLIATLQKAMGLTINHVFQTSFNGYAHVTDDVGTLSIKTDSGPREFTGAQAEAYAAAPNPVGGTIETGHRYQQWSKSLLQGTLQPSVLLNPFTLWAVFSDTTGDLVVDATLTNGALLKLAWHLASMSPSALHFVTAPNAGYGTIHGHHVLRPSPAAFAQLSAAIRTDNLATLGLFQ